MPDAAARRGSSLADAGRACRPACARPAYDPARGRRSASCISASARSTARIRRSTPTTILARRPALGHLRRVAQDAARDRAARAAGRPLHACSTRSAAKARRARDRRAARNAVRRRRARPRSSRASPIRASRVVSLTVTEKGYCHDPATGALNVAHPDIAHDLAHPEAPRVGDRHAGRRPRGAPRGGRGTAHVRLLRQPAAQRAHGRRPRARVRAARAIRRSRSGSATHVAFPSTMVDRIVPATTDADVAEAAAPARRARRRAGRRRAVRPVGDRGSLRGGAAARGRTPARSSSPTSRRSRR